jgi:sulfate/thiosulfate transport system permease protein
MADALVARGGRSWQPRAHAGGVGRLGLGVSGLWLGVIVLLPLAAVLAKAGSNGLDGFWSAISSPSAVAALRLTLIASVIVTVVNVVFGTLIAWVLVRDEFPGSRIVSALIDLPFALPTIVASIVLLALYGPNSPIDIHLAATRPGVVVALLFVTLPFVVRSVQPVLIEADREMEEAALSLGASNATTFRRIVLPTLLPAILSGGGLAFARALGEYGSVVLIGGNQPFRTQVSSQFIYDRVQSDAPVSAASVSVVLLAISFVVLFALRQLSRWSARHAD